MQRNCKNPIERMKREFILTPEREDFIQTECRISSLLEYYAEVQPFLCKESANREQNEMNVFISYAEVQPFLCKDTLFIETTIEMVAN